VGGFDDDRDLGSSRDNSQILVLNLVQDVTTLDGVLNRRVLELGQVLAGKRQDRGSLLRFERDEVRSAALVAVGRAPEREVGDGAEMDGSFDRLMGGAVLAETDGVVSGNPDDLVVAQSRETDRTGGIADKVLWARSVHHRHQYQMRRTKKVPPKGMIPPYAARPFIIAPIACSRTP
jgi:hypothetical protein